MKVKLSIVCLLAIAAFALCVSGAPTNEDEIAGATASAAQVRAGFSPAKLFDFDNYKTVFHKTYSGVVEELVRAKYFLSRAFRAFISAMKYKYRQSPYYLAVNEMSDWTPEDIQKAENKVLARESEALNEANRNAPTPQVAPDDDLPEMLPENAEEAEKELKRMADSNGQGPMRRHGGKMRELPMEKLIDTGDDAKLNPAAARKLTNSVPSDNPQYEQLELPSFGLRDEPKDVKMWEMRAKAQANPTINFMSTLGSVLSGLQSSLGVGNDGDEQFEDSVEQLPDEVFVDLRDTGCFTIPRRQGQCGSCWAFAAITLFEFMYCRKTGKLVQFSEQYMIDCGLPYIARADGCDGGIAEAAAHFVKNFGLELRSNYPYNMRENQCPYEESTDLNRTGYIRYEFNNALQIDIDHWAKYVATTPIWIGMAWLPSFHEYGGGVFGWGCEGRQAAHAVVLVGHGREDGEEYWLIRNSHSVGWGEGGYGKLAKNSECTTRRFGLIFASRNGRQFETDMKMNHLNDRGVIKDLYVQSLLV